MEKEHVKIIEIHPDDGFYPWKNLIGQTGRMKLHDFNPYPGFVYGNFFPDNLNVITVPALYFLAVKVEILPSEEVSDSVKSLCDKQECA